jgi:hypothetical protein
VVEVERLSRAGGWCDQWDVLIEEEQVSENYDWLAVAPGATIRWSKKGQIGWPRGLVAVDPLNGLVLDDQGQVRPLHPEGYNTEINRPVDYLPADPGWRKLNCWWNKEADDGAGAFENLWRPVIAWTVENGEIEQGISTDWNDDGIECLDEYHLAPPVYWHVSEGEDRRVELEQIAEKRYQLRMEMEAEAAARREQSSQ